jgi:energy-coupling factor transport system permease protein
MNQYIKSRFWYVSRSTCIHQLDPRIKLLATLGLMLVALFSELGVVLVCGISVMAIGLARLPYKRLLVSLYRLKWLFIFALFFHLFYTPGRYLFTGWGLTHEGLRAGILISTRLMLLVILSSLLMLTTPPVKLTHGLESLLDPFKYLGVPVAELSMMIMLSLQFIPVLLEEAQRLFMAQTARGIDFNRANILRKAQNMLALFVPLILGAQRRAENVALSMQLRGYNCQQSRSRLYPLKFETRDYITGSIVLGTIFLVLIFSPMAQKIILAAKQAIGS